MCMEGLQELLRDSNKFSNLKEKIERIKKEQKSLPPDSKVMELEDDKKKLTNQVKRLTEVNQLLLKMHIKKGEEELDEDSDDEDAPQASTSN